MNRSKHGLSRSRAQAGVALLEILVSVLLFSLGLLGLIGLQARAIGLSSDAEDRNRAALLANEVVAQMMLHGSATLPAEKLDKWKERVAEPTTGGLPAGVGEVEVDGIAANVTIKWRAPSRDTDSQLTTRIVVLPP
jgi:type IV pilus assembly protein PilV